MRLEKAKEHFLLRLRSEWEEDAAVSSPDNDAVDTDKVMELPEKPKKSIDPESKIRIFFPRLRKVRLYSRIFNFLCALILLEGWEVII